jgi:hypothetical protein
VIFENLCRKATLCPVVTTTSSSTTTTTTTTSTTTTTTTTRIICENLGVFNVASGKCMCRDYTSGDRCEIGNICTNIFVLILQKHNLLSCRL